MRSGYPPDEIALLAPRLSAQLILMAWFGNPDDDRSQTLRRTLDRAAVPVFLVPIL